MTAERPPADLARENAYLKQRLAQAAPSPKKELPMAHFPRNPQQPPLRGVNDPRSTGASAPAVPRSTLNDSRSTRRRRG